MDSRNENQLSLAAAYALSGDVEGLKMMLASGVDLCSLVFDAAAGGKGRSLNTLMQAGVPLNVLNETGRTPLDVAHAAGEKECAEMIRQSGGQHAFEVDRR